MDASTPPGFPLPVGHRWAPRTGDLRNHDGRDHFQDGRGLALWQDVYRRRWDHQMAVTGRYDKATQDAALALQKRAGLPLAGWVDKDTWDACWSLPTPERRKPPRAKDAIKLNPKTKHERWVQRISRYGVSYGTTPGAPEWYPGRPFGPPEEGPHVKRLQELLGLQPSGRYNFMVAARVRGIRKLLDLPACDIADVRVCAYLDPVGADEMSRKLAEMGEGGLAGPPSSPPVGNREI